MIRKLIFAIGFLFSLANVYAGQTIERHNFYDNYDPSSTLVYDDSGATATGDQIAVNTYTQKSIQISGISVNEYTVVRIEGRSKDQINTPNWAVLNTVEFGAASTDINKNKVVDVTEYVDFLRVGIQSYGTNGTSAIDIEGLFTNLER